MELTFSWPKTLGGKTATFTCPENGSHNLVMRNCTSNGLWQPFPENGCSMNTDGQLDGQLDGQNTSFTKVTLHIQQLYRLLKCIAIAIDVMVHEYVVIQNGHECL